MTDNDSLLKPADSLLNMAFTPDENSVATKASTENSTPDLAQVPAIVRLVWQLDSQLQPLPGNRMGQLFTLHLLADLPKVVKDLPKPEMEQIRQHATDAPDTLIALPFAMPDDGNEFLENLSRIVWSDQIEGVALCYETDQMMTLEEAEAAPSDPQEREKYLAQHSNKAEKSRFVVAATRTEVWSLVHPNFTTNPEHIEQGPALAPDLLHLITRNMEGPTDSTPQS